MKYRPRIKVTQRKSTRFAWLPKRMANGTWVWLERYKYREHGQ